MYIQSEKYGGACACGRDHNMTTKLVIIEPGCLKNAGNYMAEQGIIGGICALYGSNSYAATEGRHPKAAQEIVLSAEGLHADEHAVTKVLELLKDDITAIAAIGGGTIHDIGRYCAYKRGLRFISCPSCASVDGFCSSVAAMTWYGYKKTLTAVAPDIVIADTEIIKSAPFRLVKSGIGDIIAKYTALTDWRIAHELTGEYFCQQIHDMMRAAADAAIASVPGLLSGSEDAFGRVMYALALSGIAMQMMGNSRPASGAEHHISHLIEMSPPGLAVSGHALHGEKTGVGSVIVAREYKRLMEKEDILPYLTDYQSIHQEKLSDFFGNYLSPAIIRENENDCLRAVSPAALSRKWMRIRDILSGLMGAEEMYSILSLIDAKREPEDIGVSTSDIDILLEYSPLVRNRLTLMRIRRLINIPA